MCLYGWVMQAGQTHTPVPPDIVCACMCEGTCVGQTVCFGECGWCVGVFPTHVCVHVCVCMCVCVCVCAPVSILRRCSVNLSIYLTLTLVFVCVCGCVCVCVCVCVCQ